jgi:shikimate dehydrogenase
VKPATAGATILVGVFGDPVAHSVSPAMHNRAFEALGLDWCYLPFHVSPADLGVALRALPALGLRGVNLTIPHKEAALAHLDSVEETARLIGAVNTVVQEKGRLAGYNTDADGFLDTLEEAGFDPGGARAVLLGAGGSARAVAVALAGRDVAALTIIGRTPARGEAIAELVRRRCRGPVTAVAWTPAAVRQELAGADLVVNATPVGMYPRGAEPPPVPARWLPERVFVYDLVFNPPATRLVRAARRRGLRAMGGLRMLVCQGARAFRLWTGREPPRDLMEAAGRRALRARKPPADTV